MCRLSCDRAGTVVVCTVLELACAVSHVTGQGRDGSCVYCS